MTILIFPTMLELTGFELAIQAKDHIIDNQNISITGRFTEHEIHRACADFHAVAVPVKEAR